MEKIAYAILLIVLISLVIAMLAGLITLLPYGLPALVLITGFGLLFTKALKERLQSKEDNYYSKNVKL
ncbi:MAG: hypothetical protein DRP91_06445 [Candidatus Neomarinimicrobiota bacterium]|nr:hypothetical protein [Candidatus Neomarinimicrobiota bacterium]RKY46851.1 MAG: hypothetical protein DRP88_05740 [Candidatus Neomarinimicrobiota bacterium]RKY48159.1 MAG: hypothetical protein DRP91_06445 [Candidatus Neomarinimicrobiota bacterium]RKY53552.1 MAG: hypothetical protein DRP92_03260 [Candidatus Neomarinimicrobiota bacterium]